MAPNTQHSSQKLAIITAQNRANNKNRDYLIVYRHKTKKYLIRQQTSKSFQNDIRVGESLVYIVFPTTKQVGTPTKM